MANIPTINEEFLKKRPLSYSSLKQFKKSPKHYIHYLTEPRAHSAAFTLGSAIDCLLLEPDKFEDRFIVTTMYKGTGSVSLNKELKAQAEAEGKQILSPDDEALARQCIKSVLEHGMASELIQNRNAVQKKLTFRYKGLPFVGYQDFASQLVRGEIIKKIVVDLKSAQSADPKDFMRDVAKWGYPLQAATYLNYYKRKYFQFPDFYWLVVEKNKPFGVSVIRMDDKDKTNAMNEFDLLVKSFKYCMKNDLWHMGYDFWLFEMKEVHTELVPRWYNSYGQTLETDL